MKKLIFAALLSSGVLTASAGPLDVFNHLGVGAGVGTNGVSVELATPITTFVQMRAGVSYMPGITFNSDVDYSYEAASVPHTGTATLKGDIGRVQGQVLFNVYPAPVVPFYISVGAYFGGNKLMKITGQSPELAALAGEGGAVIGGYEIPADPQGNVSGGFKVKGFRPYVGIGWGRAIPGKLVNFALDLGVQFQGKPELYTDYGEIDDAVREDDNTFNKIADALKVYPTLTFRLNFRAF